MVKNWGSVWALLALVALAAFGVLAYSAPQPQRQTSYNYSNQHPEDKNQSTDYIALVSNLGDFLESHNGTISALSAFITAIFTFVLAWKTWGLHSATRGLQSLAAAQGSDMQKSIIAAQQSADAARKAADVSEQALSVIERPYVYLGQIGVNITNPVKDVQIVEISYKIENLGRTPATINSMFIKTFIASNIEPNITTLTGDTIKGIVHIAPNQDRKLPFYRISTSSVDLVGIFSLKSHVYFAGERLYRRVWE